MQTRHLLIAATFLLSMLLYVDRVCISTAKTPVQGELGFSDKEMGWIFAAFSLGYALFQTPSGMLADRFGPRVALATVVCAWSAFTALTAAARQLATMLVVRFLFGMGEAGAFPGMARAFYSWLPMSERGLAQGINFSAARLGAAIAFPVVGGMVQWFGWRETFVILGGVGFVWAAAWIAWFRDDPAHHPRISADEREHILATRQQAGTRSAAKLSLRAVARSADMWLLMAQYFASNFTFFFCLTWLVPHLEEQYSLSTIEAGRYAMLPFLAGMVGNWTAGAMIDGLYRRERWLWSRRLPAMLGFALATIGLLASLAAATPLAAAACLAVAIFGADMTVSPSWSACIDIGRHNAGAVSGTMNMAGNIGSFVTALAFPYLHELSGSTTPFFVVAAVLNVAAIAAWQFTRVDRPLEDV